MCTNQHRPTPFLRERLHANVSGEGLGHSCQELNVRRSCQAISLDIRASATRLPMGDFEMRKAIAGAGLLALLMAGAARAEDTVKIGYIDPLSGGGASVGEGGLKTFLYLADELNAKGGILGHKVEIVPMDNKTNPQESLVQAQKAVDAGIHYITQGNGSSV